MDVGAHPSAAGVQWDLSQAFASDDEARVFLAEALHLQRRLAHMVFDEELDTARLSAVLDDLNALRIAHDALRTDYGYPALRLSSKVDDVAARDLVAELEPHLNAIADTIAAAGVLVGGAHADPGAEELAPYGNWLRLKRAAAIGRLEPAAEEAFASRSPSARAAWGRLFTTTMSGLELSIDAGDGPRPHTLSEGVSLLRHGDAQVRRRALEAIDRGCDEVRDVTSACLDAVVADRRAEDHLRGLVDPRAATLVQDDLDVPVVEAVLSATEGRAGIFREWLERKRLAWGSAELHPADRFATVGVPPPVPWQNAVELCREVFASLGVGAVSIVDELLARNRIDAEIRPGKDGAIYCAALPTGMPTYVIVTYTDEARTASQLAHELGHAVHFELAKRTQQWLALAEPENLAFVEVPSTFAELMLIDTLRSSNSSPETKAIVRAALESLLTLVTWAATLHRFEQDLSALRDSGSVLTPDRIERAWTARSEVYAGSALTRHEFQFAPHIWTWRFYNHQYVFAALASLCLRAIRRENPLEFDPRYVSMLEATGSMSPTELLATCGVDVTDSATWHRGLDELETLCNDAW